MRQRNQATLKTDFRGEPVMVKLDAIIDNGKVAMTVEFFSPEGKPKKVVDLTRQELTALCRLAARQAAN